MFKDVCGWHETIKHHRKIKLNTVLLRIYHTIPEAQYLDRIILGIGKSTFRSKGNRRLSAYKRSKYQARQLARPANRRRIHAQKPQIDVNLACIGIILVVKQHFRGSGIEVPLV